MKGEYAMSAIMGGKFHELMQGARTKTNTEGMAPAPIAQGATRKTKRKRNDPCECGCGKKVKSCPKKRK